MKVEAYGKTKQVIKFSDVQENNGWANITPQALKFAKAKIPKGSEVDVERDGKGTIVKIFLKGGVESKSKVTSETSANGIIVVKYLEGNVVLLKENETEKPYVMTPAAYNYGLKQVPEGTATEITVDDNNVITNIKKKEVTGGMIAGTLNSPDRYSYPKCPEERAEIMAQSVGHMVSRIVNGMASAGTVDPNNYTALISEIFKTVANEVSELSKIFKVKE